MVHFSHKQEMLNDLPSTFSPVPLQYIFDVSFKGGNGFQEKNYFVIYLHKSFWHIRNNFIATLRKFHCYILQKSIF